MSKHIRVLEDAGLLRREVRGREHYLSLESGPLREAMEWIARNEAFRETRPDGLERVLIDSERKVRKSSDG